LSEPGFDVKVQIRYKEVDKIFVGTAEDVWACVNRFFAEFVPTFEVASKLVLKVDLQALAKDCEGLIGFSKEGVSLLVDRDKLTDNEALLMWLLGAYVGFRLGFVDSEAFSKDDLQTKLGKSGKIVSTRLGELVKTDYVMKDGDEKFRLTTFGVTQLQKETLPRIKTKTTSPNR
jgi:hypothetical protein